MGNAHLDKARKRRDDEYYTKVSDIEKEVTMYREDFEGSKVYCNCDDPKSGFVKYFLEAYDDLKLKGLRSSFYKPCSLFEDDPPVTMYRYGDVCESKPLKTDGDFRSYECVDFLKECDIVCTNPPFSLARNFFRQLIKHNKKFLFIGPEVLLTFDYLTEFIMSGDLHVGYNVLKEFDRPDGSTKAVNCQWYTNLNRKFPNFLDLKHPYSEDKHIRYGDEDAIEVKKTSEIPNDYDGIMGVPISFMKKYNPKQFKVVGISQQPRYKGTTKFCRILIRHA